MAKYKCSISGIYYHCPSSNIIGVYSNHNIIHPIFTLHKRDLDNIYRTQLLAHKLTLDDSLLLAIALLNEAKLLHFQNVEISLNWQGMVKNASRLLAALPDIMTISDFCYQHEPSLKVGIKQTGYIFLEHSSIILPRLAVSKENNTLANIIDIVEALLDCITEFKNEQRGYARNRRLRQATELYDSIIINPLHSNATKEHRKLAQIEALAEIVSIIAEFPRTHSANWKSLIYLCAISPYSASELLRTKQTQLYNVQSDDIQDCINHILTHCELTSIHATACVDILRRGLANYNQIFGTINSALYKTQVLARVDMMPKDKPIRFDYNTLGDYIQALAQWQEYQRLTLADSNTSNTIITTLEI